ncbi:hypothetical protein DPEC_G00232610 [Dallia pectoralis]|uniref:Uncharacterized protein n=1 Tax=Dallia pectoralis TaxID=75939 RepID=A0ACC2FXC3_DALPE|nr:hypothetical protein DPEC_G00232610 [Dallia pectoralis]
MSVPSEMSNPQLFQQLALLGWLRSGSEQDKDILTALTGIQVAQELMDRLTGQREVDAFKTECIRCIADFVQSNPRATQDQINAEVKKHVLVFAARVKALDSAPLL